MIARTQAIATVGFILVAALMFTQAQPARARFGEIYKGELVSVDNDKLLLNIKPCSPESDRLIVSFQAPYRMKATEKVTCQNRDKTYVSTEVEQR